MMSFGCCRLETHARDVAGLPLPRPPAANGLHEDNARATQNAIDANHAPASPMARSSQRISSLNTSAPTPTAISAITAAPLDRSLSTCAT